MRQVFVAGSGEVEVLDVPVPGPLPQSVLVRNAYSLISTGTESSSVSRHGGWRGALDKGLRSGDRVKQVWELARVQGIPVAWERVRQKLAELSAPGYSSAGQVLEVSGDAEHLRPGDWVACMGAGFATHSEYAVVPIPLVSRLPDGIDTAESAFGAIACIALQGIRRLDLSPGESIGIIGLGLVGQITAQLVGILGYRGVGVDLVPERASRARDLAGIEAWGETEADTKSRVAELTGGQGLDGVIVCAATASDAPVNLAFDLCRRRGRVSLVGDVGLTLMRSKMYAKELELRMSCSYGPGRYDEDYELRGQDYPLAHVRWTERRNLECVVSLLQRRVLRLLPLVSHRFPIDRGADAYEVLARRDPELYGVLLEYPPAVNVTRPPREAYVIRSLSPRGSVDQGRVALGLIGCGKFTRAVHLPNLRRLPGRFRIVGAVSRSGASAREVARLTGAEIATSDYRVLLEEPTVEAVLVATRHADHVAIVLDALAAGKHVFVEKPLCLTTDDGERVVARADETGLVVRVGFNRRFSPHLRLLRRVIGCTGRRILSCRVNVGPLLDDWSNTPEQGGRFLGEGVHFFDLVNWFMREWPARIQATCVGETVSTNPDLAVEIAYGSGSVAHLLYTTLGDVRAGKERYEAFGNGRTAICDDYRQVEIFGSRERPPRRGRADKGHLAEWEEFANAVRGRADAGEGADARSGLWATRMALAALESARCGEAVTLDGGRDVTPNAKAT